jgi:hypothetical protein
MDGTHNTWKKLKMRTIVLVVKSEGKGPLRRVRRRSEDNIKMDIKKYVVRLWTIFIMLKICYRGKVL